MRYNLTAIEILNILGYTESSGKAKFEAFEQENHIKLPSIYLDFLSIATDNPLFATGDIWTDSPYFSYVDIEERIDDDEEYWKENPDEYEDNEYFQLSKIPKEQWSEHVANYLQFGSDYAAGVVVYGICEKDLEKDNPPVYMLHEEDPVTEWKKVNDTLSDWLIAALCDILTFNDYHTAEKVLEKEGWSYKISQYKNAKQAQEELAEKHIELSQMQRYFALTGVDRFYSCGFMEEENTIFIIKKDNKCCEIYYITK